MKSSKNYTHPEKGLCYCGQFTTHMYASLWECDDCHKKRKVYEGESMRISQKNREYVRTTKVTRTMTDRLYNDDWNKPIAGIGESLIPLEEKLKSL